MLRKLHTSILLAALAAFMLLAAAAPAMAAQPKLVAVTFDDGPSKYTNGLLDELAKRDVQVTFFVVGRNAKAYESTIRKAYEAGHQIASHTYSHPQLTKLSSAEVKSQVSRTAEILNSIISPADSYMLRPPYGSYSARVLADINTPAIMWSVDTRDWESRKADSVYRHIVNDTKDGSIILMHDLYPSTVDGALRGIDYLQKQGYELVTVSELLRRRGISPAAGNAYGSAANQGSTLPGIAAPKISADYSSGQALVTITADPGAKIYYSVDYSGEGGAPTSQSQVYTEPLRLEDSATVRAFAALRLNGGRSRVAQARIERPRTPAPRIVLRDGQAAVSAAAGAQIYYVLNDTQTSGLACAVYTQPIPLRPGDSLAVTAVLPEHLPSSQVKLIYSPLGNIFYDVNLSSWYFPDVDKAVAAGLLTTQDGLFMPDVLVRRGDLAAVLHRLAGSPEPQNPSEQLSPAVQWAVEQGILSGCPDGTLQLEAPLTREQLAVILQRALAGQGEPNPQGGQAAGLADYADGAQVGAYARPAMEWALTQGIIKGNEAGLLNPAANLSRAELASILTRLP